MAGPRFQFSIRRLLAVTTVIAATVGALAAEPSRISAAVLILLAVAFPAVFAAGLICKSGLWKAFCAGAIIPAGIAFKDTMGGLFWAVHPPGPDPGVLDALESLTRDAVVRKHAALCWLAMLTVGLMAVAFFGLACVNSPYGNERKARRASLVGLATFWLLLAAAAVGALATERTRYSGSAIILLVCAFPAALATGIVGSDSAVKAFCAGAMLPAGIALYVTVAHFYRLDSLEDIPRLFDAIEDYTMLRPFIGLFWALTAIMGLASVVAYRAFCSGLPKDR
jgi:hypothetical protein